MDGFSTPIRAPNTWTGVVPDAPRKPRIKRVPSVRRNLAAQFEKIELQIITDMGDRYVELLSWGELIEMHRK